MRKSTCKSRKVIVMRSLAYRPIGTDTLAHYWHNLSIFQHWLNYLSPRKNGPNTLALDKIPALTVPENMPFALRSSALLY